MKITKNEFFTIIEAEEGKVLSDADGVYEGPLYLGINDSPDNYQEIDKEDTESYGN